MYQIKAERLRSRQQMPDYQLFNLKPQARQAVPEFVNTLQTAT